MPDYADAGDDAFVTVGPAVGDVVMVNEVFLIQSPSLNLVYGVVVSVENQVAEVKFAVVGKRTIPVAHLAKVAIPVEAQNRLRDKILRADEDNNNGNPQTERA